MAQRARTAGLLLVLGVAAACTSRPPAARVEPLAQKVCQLTGEYDQSFAPPRLTTNRTETHARLAGTDLGASFRGPFGSVFFLFGDSAASPPYAPPGGSDAVAYARADDDPDDCVSLTFYTSSPDHRFQPPSVPGEPLPEFGVPTGAFFANGNTYVFFMNKINGGVGGFPNHSFLARAAGVPADKLVFQKLRDLPHPWMLGVSPVAVDDSFRPSTQPTQVLLFAAGPYRKTDTMHLLRVRVSEIETGQFELLTGFEADGRPKWGAKGVLPVDTPTLRLLPQGGPLFGEFSVAYNPFLDRWLLLAESDATIHVRSAVDPWGPWSEPTPLFKSDKPAGHCLFLFTGDPSTACPAGMTNPHDMLIPDDPANPRAKQGGGAYAPYIIDAYTKGDSARKTSRIYFAMSTWNPYQVVLMRADLARDLTLGEAIRSWFEPGATSSQRTGSK